MSDLVFSDELLTEAHMKHHGYIALSETARLLLGQKET